MESPLVNVYCIYREHEHLGKTKKEINVACKKPRMVATINKPLPINFNVLMFLSQELEDFHSFHNDVLVIKVQISNALSQSCVGGQWV